MADDLGRNDVGFSDPTVLSPEIDTLAKTGVQLDACYTYSWCAPSRGSMLGSRFCTKNMISEGTSRARTPVKLQYEPRITVLQHGYDVCATKYGRLGRLVPSEIPFFVQNLGPSLVYSLHF